MKKIVFLTLTLLLLAALCVGIGFSAMAADTNNVNALEQKIMAGYALPEIPEDAEPISSYAELMMMRMDGTYYLTADISMETIYGFDFSGTLYGNGHTITVNGDPVFRTLLGATVRDLTIVGTVNCPANKNQNAGGLVSQAINTTIIGVTNKASIHQGWKGKFAGGIAGYAADTTFKYCVNYGEIAGDTTELRPGGIMGQCDDAYAWIVLENCINHGTINGVNQTGGLVSRIEKGSSLRMIDCANFGTVNVSSSDSGGLVGKVSQNYTDIYLQRCYNSGRVNGGKIVGGIVSVTYVNQLTAIDCYNGCFVDGCDCNGTNHGKLSQKGAGDMGGLFGTSNLSDHSVVQLENCANYGEIQTTASSRIGGICSIMETKSLSVKNCHNYANLTTPNDHCGGLFGRVGCREGVLLFEDCSNSGNISAKKNAGGLFAVIELSKNSDGLIDNKVLASIPELVFTNCTNTGDLLGSQYVGGLAGLAQATKTTMTDCSNSGTVNLTSEKSDADAEIGGLAGCVYGTFTATNCLNTGDIFTTAKASNQEKLVMIGGIVGRVGIEYEQHNTKKEKKYIEDAKGHFATFTKCANTGVLGGSKAIADAATTYVITAGGIIGDSNGVCTANYCVSTGDIFCNQQAGGISALAGQSGIGGSTYESCVVTGDIYNSGHKTTYNSAGAGGISCYVWGHALVYHSTIISDIHVGTSSSNKTMDNRWACAALIGYTNNAGGEFKNNYFTGSLTSNGGTDCYLVFVGNTKDQNVASDEGSAIVDNYSKNEYNLHANKTTGYSTSVTAPIITVEEMAALNGSSQIVKTCDGVEIPIRKDTGATYANALKGAGHKATLADVDNAQHGGVCACGAVLYENHVYENVCDTDCSVCGHTRTVGDHVGQYDCSTTCKYCDATITAKSQHTGEFACSATCQWCDTAIQNPAGHSTTLPCDTACSLCGASVTGEAHAGELICSESCKWCGTDVIGAKHEGEYACSLECKVCGTDLNNSLPCVGVFVCSTTCKYCGDDIVPQANHTKEYECSTACQICGVTMTGAHEGITDCATKCRYCAVTIIPDANHTVNPEKPCSEQCMLCGETTIATQLHTYDKACSVACSVCGYTRSNAADHNYSAACDATCNQCGFERDASHDPGLQRCADTCMFCGENLEDLAIALIPCAGEFACSEICQWCGGAVADPADHTTAYACDTVCLVCDGAVDSEGHTGLYPCSETCRYCEIEIEAAGDHKYTDGCDDTCNNCLQKTRKADHRYNNNCDVDCNRCGAVRVPADHVYSNACDADCDSCGETRTPAEHVYDNPCKDMDCNECGELRTPGDHTYDGCTDVDCNGCGTERTAGTHNYEGVEWVVVTPATTEADGVQERACATCGAKETQAIAKLTSGNEGGSMILGLERDTFIIIVGAAAAAILVIVIVVAVAVSKKKKTKKKAEKAAKAAEAAKAEEAKPVEESEAVEPEASEAEANQGEQES